MRAGLLYVFFVAFILLLVSSKHTSNKPLRYDVSSSQTVTVSKKSACVVPVIGISLQKLYLEYRTLGFIYKNIFESSSRIGSSSLYLRMYQAKVAGYKPLLQRPFFIIILPGISGEDHHILS